MIKHLSNREVSQVLRRHGKFPPMAGGALQSIVGGFWVPTRLNSEARYAVWSAMLLDAASEKAAFIFRAPKTGTVSKLVWRTGTVTTGATLDIRLESVSLTTGDPSGTLLGANTNGSQVVADTDDNTQFVTAMTAGVAVTKGDLLAVVIVNPSVSPGNLQVTLMDVTNLASSFPYSTLYTTSWGRQMWCPVVGLEYNDGSYAWSPGCFPLSNFTDVAFNSGSTPDEMGVKFRFPFPCTVAGFWAHLNPVGDTTIKLYDTDGSTVLVSLTLDKDVKFANAPGQAWQLFASTVNLVANSWYRLTIVPDTVSNVEVERFTVASAAQMDGLEIGQNMIETSRTDAGAWTDTATQRIVMGLFISGFDDAVGGGGATESWWL